MATRIITKNGSGAPLAGDLSQGELAVDLTNKRLYTKDSGGSIIEVGSNGGSSTLEDLTVAGDLTVDTDTLYVDSTNDRVGINTDNPSATLDVYDNTGSLSATKDDTATFRRIDGTYNPRFEIRHSTDGTDLNHIYTTSAGNLTFSIVNSERMRLDASGNLLVGYTSSNGAYKLQVNSQIFATNATIATSDAKFKENVTPIESTGALIDALNPVLFDWTQDTEHNFLECRDVGFIAQEVEAALSGAEYADAVVAKSEHYGLAYEKLIPMLVKEIQDLRARVAQLEGN